MYASFLLDVWMDCHSTTAFMCEHRGPMCKGRVVLSCPTTSEGNREFIVLWGWKVCCHRKRRDMIMVLNMGITVHKSSCVKNEKAWQRSYFLISQHLAHLLREVGVGLSVLKSHRNFQTLSAGIYSINSVFAQLRSNGPSGAAHSFILQDYCTRHWFVASESVCLCVCHPCLGQSASLS